MRCYLKEKLQPLFTKELTAFNKAGPFGEDLHGKKCAVVSSSGAHLEHHYGEDIDSADAVFRMNDADVKGYEKYVGSRETVRFTNQFVRDKGNPFVSHPKVGVDINPNVTYVMLSNLDDKTMLSMTEKYPEVKAYAYPWRLYTSVNEVMSFLYGDRWLKSGQGHAQIPSTGSVGVFLALSFCGSVELFEFATSNHAKDSPYNYYGRHYASKSAEDNAVHGWFQAEHDLWDRLSYNRTNDVHTTGRAVLPGFDSCHCKQVWDLEVPRFTSTAPEVVSK